MEIQKFINLHKMKYMELLIFNEWNE